MNNSAKGEVCGEGTPWGCKVRLNIHTPPLDQGVLVLDARKPEHGASEHVVFHQECAPWERLRPATAA